MYAADRDIQLLLEAALCLQSAPRRAAADGSPVRRARSQPRTAGAWPLESTEAEGGGDAER